MLPAGWIGLDLVLILIQSTKLLIDMDASWITNTIHSIRIFIIWVHGTKDCSSAPNSHITNGDMQFKWPGNASRPRIK